VRALIEQEDCAITSVNLAEAIDVCSRVHRMAQKDVDAAVAPLLAQTIRVLAPGIEDARRAAAIRVSHYRPRTCELSIADCFLLAAPDSGDSLCTVDPPVLRVADELGIETFPLS